MQIKRLKITNVRVFEHAEFNFQPGMNLLVGINGAGKSTVLDVLRIMLSKQMHNFTAARGSRIHFDENHIASRKDSLSLELDFELAGIPFKHTMTQERGGTNTDGELTPRYGAAVRREVEKYHENPVAIYFSPSRSLPDSQSPKPSVSENSQATAYVDALKSRRLRLKEFAQWWSVVDALRNERPHYTRIIAGLNEAVQTFLNGYSNLRAKRNSQTLLIDKNGSPLDVRHLSDGERSVLAVVFDIAKRLILANPNLDDPLADGRGVILLDEIGIHLHPSWERKIVERLTNTFPRCQFIATTHSPQIFGEVDRGNITIIEHGKVRPPFQSLGMDSNWILENELHVDERESSTKSALQHIYNLIDDEEYDQAKQAVALLRQERGVFPELTGLQTEIDLMTFDEDDDEHDDIELENDDEEA